MSASSASPALIAAYPALATMPPDLLAAVLARDAQYADAPAGAQLFEEGAPCRGFPLVLSGEVRVARGSAQGRALELYRVTPGETCVISSSCLLGQEDYNARGITEADTLLMLLPKAVFDELLAEPAFRGFVFHLFAERIADLMQIIEEVAFHKLDQRLAGLLLGKGRLLHTTHQQLADELGSVREIVSRLLKGFAAQGLVKLAREQIEILDPAGLRRVAAGN